jgi:hypothetical protein
VASVWKHPKSQYWTACFRDQNGRQRRISTKETNNKKALKIAEEFERAAKTKRTLKQVQNVLDRLHEEVSGQRVVRTTFGEYLSDWLMAKKAETAVSTNLHVRFDERDLKTELTLPRQISTLHPGSGG